MPSVPLTALAFMRHWVMADTAMGRPDEHTCAQEVMTASPTCNAMLVILSCHKLRLQPLLCALQAYADAVLDEAPLLVLTDYNVTVFLRRSGDVKDNRLWASELVWADQHNPPARAAWLNALQEAHKLRLLKQMLPRAGVPHTLEAHQTQPRQQQPETQRQQAASESLVPRELRAASNGSAAHSRKRKRAEIQQTEEPGAPVRAVRHHMASSVTDPAAEETLLLSELGLTDKHLVGEPYGYTYKVSQSFQLKIAPHLMLQHLVCSSYLPAHSVMLTLRRQPYQ